LEKLKLSFMKKIIIWISAITRYLFSNNYSANSPTYKATKLSKREPPLAIAKPQKNCKGLSCQQNCMQKATPTCTKGRATIYSMIALTQWTT
jgi:hypothetical protein